MPAFAPVDVEKLSPDKKTVVGFAIVGHPDIKYASPATLTANPTDDNPLEVPLKFFSGSLELIRAEIHNRVDNAINILYEQWG